MFTTSYAYVKNVHSCKNIYVFTHFPGNLSLILRQMQLLKANCSRVIAYLILMRDIFNGKQNVDKNILVILSSNHFTITRSGPEFTNMITAKRRKQYLVQVSKFAPSNANIDQHFFNHTIDILDPFPPFKGLVFFSHILDLFTFFIYIIKKIPVDPQRCSDV